MGERNRTFMKVLVTCVITIMAVFGFIPFVRTGMVVNAEGPSIQEDPDFSASDYRHHYVCMSKSGEDILNLTTDDIASCNGSFILYDDGKASTSYSKDMDSKLTLTAPEGYRFHIGGLFFCDTGDWLTIYDGDSNSPLLLDRKTSFNAEAVNVFSTTKSITVYFKSNNNFHHQVFILM